MSEVLCNGLAIRNYEIGKDIVYNRGTHVKDVAGAAHIDGTKKTKEFYILLYKAPTSRIVAYNEAKKWFPSAGMVVDDIYVDEMFLRRD